MHRYRLLYASDWHQESGTESTQQLGVCSRTFMQALRCDDSNAASGCSCRRLDVFHRQLKRRGALRADDDIIRAFHRSRRKRSLLQNYKSKL